MLNHESILKMYKNEFMSLQAEGDFKEYLGVPFGVNLNSVLKKEGCSFTKFLLSTIKYSRFDDWHEDEVPEEVAYLEKCLNGNGYISVKPNEIINELNFMNSRIKEYDKSLTLKVSGGDEKLVMGYKFKFAWNHWSIVGETTNFYIAYHWYTCE